MAKTSGYDPMGDPRTGRPPLPAERERQKATSPDEARGSNRSDEEIEVVESDEAGLAHSEEFSAGQLVSLKSGGPVMTVSAVENGLITCQWFGEGDEIQTSSFGAELLELVERDAEASESFSPRQ
jgi:uncharacterized protein YodC (DUF2158 family)